MVIVTTYAGSEVTGILGETREGVKTTVTDPRIQPDMVIYDPELTYQLPVNVSITSSMNAMAHAAEALYAKDRNPISDMMAIEGARAIVSGLKQVVSEPDHPEGRRQLLYGAWLCGTVLGMVGMSLHHKLCHTLGGLLNLPHADTHTILLPHTVAFNEASAASQLLPLADALSAETAGGGLYDFASSVSAPMALKALGMKEDDIEKAALQALAKPYWNPRSFDQSQIEALLTNAYWGHRPETL